MCGADPSAKDSLGFTPADYTMGIDACLKAAERAAAYAAAVVATKSGGAPAARQQGGAASAASLAATLATATAHLSALQSSLSSGVLMWVCTRIHSPSLSESAHLFLLTLI